MIGFDGGLSAIALAADNSNQHTSPDPSSLKVGRSLAGDMQTNEGGDAGVRRMSGGSLAVADLNAGAGEASEADMDVPHSGGTLLTGGIGSVPFDDNGTDPRMLVLGNEPQDEYSPGGTAAGGEDHIGNFRGSLVSGITNCSGRLARECHGMRVGYL